jgi:hypothetical protein
MIKKDTHTAHVQAQMMSSCHQNNVVFDKNGDNYIPYSSSTKKWKYCWQHCVTIHKIIIGRTWNVLKLHTVICQLKSLRTSAIEYKCAFYNVLIALLIFTS